MPDTPTRQEFLLLMEMLKDGFSGINKRLDVSNGRLGKVEDAVLIIQTERAAEEKHALKRGTWAGLFASAGLTGLITVLKGYFGK